MRSFILGAFVLAPLITVAANAQSTGPSVDWGAAQVPFNIGEELTFSAKFAGIKAGTARMRVDGIDTVRGRPAYHVVFTIDGGIPFFHVRDRYDSWLDVATLSSLRHTQQISEGRYKRNTTYEIYPERAAYQKDSGEVTASVTNPLDDGSFIYAVRVAAIRVGETRREDRYFKPDRNPVVLVGVRNDTIDVGAGRFNTVVVSPSIRAKGLFAEGGEAQVWFSDDDRRYPVQLKSHFGKFSLTLTLQSVIPGDSSGSMTLARANNEGR